MTDHRIGWVWLAAGWVVLTAGLFLLLGPWGLVVGGLAACIVGVLVVDWEEVTRGEPAVPADPLRTGSRS